MNIRGKRLAGVAVKHGYQIKEGAKHILVLADGKLITTIPRGKIKDGTLRGILKRLGISVEQLSA